MRTPTLFSIWGTLPMLVTAILMQDVTKAGFETLLKDNELLVVAFSARTFAPVQAFHEAFGEAAESVKTLCVIIDCDEEKELCGSYDVNAYPAVRLFKKNGGKDVEVTRYRGRRTKRAIRSFVTKHEIPTVTHIEPENVGAFKATDDIVIMAYLRPDQEALLEVFRTVASKHHADYVFGYVTDMPTADAEGLAMPSIVCYKNTDGDNKVMNGHFSEADVGKFLETATRTVIGEFNERNMDVYMAVSSVTQYPHAHSV